VYSPIMRISVVDETTLTALLEALIAANRAFLSQFSRPNLVPLLYASGVVYQTDTEPEQWRDIPTCLIEGCADCKSLVAWRVAELRHRGEAAAMPRAVRQLPRNDGRPAWHVIVKRESGIAEDPSRILGMLATSKGV
jgi:hypothetical protein